MVRKLLKTFGQPAARRRLDKRTREYRSLLEREARIGGRLFGPLAADARREFFCLDKHTWVWHEEWRDAAGIYHTVTTRYDVRPTGIFKAQDGQPYRLVPTAEAQHLRAAVLLYNQLVTAELYKNL